MLSARVTRGARPSGTERSRTRPNTRHLNDADLRRCVLDSVCLGESSLLTIPPPPPRNLYQEAPPEHCLLAIVSTCPYVSGSPLYDAHKSTSRDEFSSVAHAACDNPRTFCAQMTLGVLILRRIEKIGYPPVQSFATKGGFFQRVIPL